MQEKVRTSNIRLLWIPCVLLVGGVLLAMLATFSMRKAENQYALAVFEARVDRIVSTTKNRLEDYQGTLQGALGLFRASKSVERNEFKAYVDSLDLSQHLPGIRAIGYTEFIGDAEKLHAFIEGVRADGFPDFTVFPGGDRSEYHPVKYIEPFHESNNKRAFGFDAYSEAVRRYAMDTARSSGKPTLSGTLSLKQDEEKQDRAEMILFLPYYRNGAPTDTLEQRLVAFEGLIDMSLLMDDIIIDVLKTVDAAGVNMEIFDGNQNGASLLFSNDQEEEDNYQPLFKNKRDIAFADKTLTVVYHSSESYDVGIVHQSSTILLFAGLLISAVLSVGSFFLLRAKRDAEKRAVRIANDMQKNKEIWKLALEANGDGVWDWDFISKTVKRNKRYSQMLGYDEQEIEDNERSWEKLVHPEDIGPSKAELEKHFRKETNFYMRENRMLCKDGSYRWILDRGKIITWTEDSKPARMIGTCTDITDRKAFENNLAAKNTELERMNDLMVGRELKMQELKQELEILRTKGPSGLQSS